MTQARLDHLPDEVLVEIFSYFGFRDLQQTIPLVCQRWRQLSQSSLLWKDKELIVTGKRQEEESCRGLHCICVKMEKEAIRIARSVPELRRLTVKYMIKSKTIRKLCTYCPNITHLELHRNIKPSYSLLEDVFGRCQKIKHLTLAFRELANRERAELVSRLEQLSCLRVVGDTGYYYDQLGQMQLRILADGCPRLEEIHFIWNYYNRPLEKFFEDHAGNEGYIDRIIDHFYKRFPIEELEYFLEAKRSSLTSATLPWMIGRIRCVVPLLTQCNINLKKLQLTLFYMPPELQGEAFEALGELRGLHKLSMTHVSPSQPELFSLPFQPGNLTQLRRLQLHRAFNLSDETVIAISQGCPSLCELRITFSLKITDTALSEICSLKCLEILELSGCNELGGAAMIYIANLPALHTLVLQHITDLAKLQPSLRFIVDMNKLRCLDIAYSRNIAAVPFDAFPSRLVNLRQLHFSCQQKTVVAKLQEKMPLLKIVNTEDC